MKIKQPGTITIDQENILVEAFSLEGNGATYPQGSNTYEQAMLEVLGWLEDRIAEERSKVMEMIFKRNQVNLAVSLEPAAYGYHQMLQAELNRRPELRAQPLKDLTPEQLLAISRRELPVFNRSTGERIV